MLGDDPDSPDLPLLGIFEGVVVRNNDPEQLGRVTVRIPGVIEPESDWAWPFGMPGSGAPQRGIFDPPDVDAEVWVQFVMGNPDRPVYACGPWGKPGGTNEVPSAAVAEVSADDTPKIKVWETEKFLLVFDGREESRLRVIHKTTGHGLDYDAASSTLRMLGGTKVIIDAAAIELGDGAVEEGVKGTSLKTYLDLFFSTKFELHIHPVAGSSTGPPLPAFGGNQVPASALSSVVKTK